jgi:hypothetical protein
MGIKFCLFLQGEEQVDCIWEQGTEKNIWA